MAVSKSKKYILLLTGRTDNSSSILKMYTGVKTNPTMTAVQERGLCSNTPHIIQEYWASPLSKGSPENSNNYCIEKQRGNHINKDAKCIIQIIVTVCSLHLQLNYSLETTVTIFLLIDQFCIMKFTPELLNPSAGLDPYMQHMYILRRWLLLSSNIHITLPEDSTGFSQRLHYTYHHYF